MFALRLLLRRFVRQGRLGVIDHTGRRYDFGAPGAQPGVTVRLHDPALYRRLALYPNLHVGTAYTEGTLTVEDGTLADLLNLLLLNEQLASKGRAGDLKRRVDELSRLGAVINLPSRARRNVHYHYDHNADFYRLFLDEDMQYSCGYFASEQASLEEAQEAKKRHIAAKLDIQPGQRVLDIGCGFGGMALFLARNYGVHVTGVTLSTEQYKVATERAAKQGLTRLVDFRLQDYRHIRETFDRIVSVGMFEHVGRPHYGQFFTRLNALLTDRGVALLHTIGRNQPPQPINVWIRQNIFPGAYLPSLSQLVPVLEKLDLWLTDFESLRLHYAATLREWNRRFQANRERVRALDPQRHDERFCRMWEFYLQSCEAGFRHSGLTVFQLQIAKHVSTLPITRDYMPAEEQRLATAAAATRAAGE
ncbi:MAG TPA: cyclopropane-fatty-acyl-phospholipid synthase family protein [Hyphomicrobiaceae bacterium]|nr:cyclopropane-fatty-acyl-phospholipid synthase family protein [Hyphomicrobiaceae bacterium]